MKEERPVTTRPEHAEQAQKKLEYYPHPTEPPNKTSPKQMMHLHAFHAATTSQWWLDDGK